MQGTYISHADGLRICNALDFSEDRVSQITNAMREGWLGPTVHVQHEPRVDVKAALSKMAFDRAENDIAGGSPDNRHGKRFSTAHRATLETAYHQNPTSKRKAQADIAEELGLEKIRVYVSPLSNALFSYADSCWPIEMVRKSTPESSQAEYVRLILYCGQLGFANGCRRLLLNQLCFTVSRVDGIGEGGPWGEGGRFGLRLRWPTPRHTLRSHLHSPANTSAPKPPPRPEATSRPPSPPPHPLNALSNAVQPP